MAMSTNTLDIAMLAVRLLSAVLPVTETNPTVGLSGLVMDLLSLVLAVATALTKVDGDAIILLAEAAAVSMSVLATVASNRTVVALLLDTTEVTEHPDFHAEVVVS